MTPAPGRPGPVRVVLATYNGERWLAGQLESIARQTLPPDEILVFDDGSTDATPAILGAFAARHPGWVSVTRRPANLGPTANFLWAVESLSGGVVVLCDQDDVWHRDRVERCVAHLATADGVFSDGTLVDEQGRAVGRTLWGTVGFTDRRLRAWAADPIGVLLQGNVVTGATLAFHRRSLDPFLPTGTRGWHDLAIAVLLAAGGRLVAEPEPLVDYRLHPGNTAGLPAFRLASRRRSRRDHLASLAEVAAQLAELEGALARAGFVGAAARLAGKRRHVDRRLGMPTARGARLWRVADEVRRGQYHRYGSGFGSATQDLLSR